MELGLKKKRIELYDTVFSGAVTHEENTEIIVPDLSPDIVRIVKGCGSAFVREKSAREGKIDIGGNIKGAVLYMAEGDKRIRKLDISMPFAYVIEASGITADSKVCVSAHLRSVDVREINPRKVSVRANVEVQASAFEPSTIELCGEVDNSKEYGIEQHMRKVGLYLPMAVKDKSFTISDECELPSDAMTLAEMLASDVALSQTDLKIIGNKAIMKGVASINYMYNHEDGSPASGEAELPFSQIIDIDGMTEDYDLRVMMSVRGAEIVPQYDAAGQARYMTVNILCDACAIAYLREDIECVDDVYSTRCELELRRDYQPCTKLCERMSKRVAVSETIETGANIKRVLDVSVNLYPYTRRREEGGEVIGNDAVISAVYIGDDDSVYSASRRASVICPLELSAESDYSCETYVKAKSFSVGTGNEINVRFFTDYEIMETATERVAAISAIALDTEKTHDISARPSVTIKRLEKRCDLWELAKEHGTTIDEIVLANGIDREALLEAGRMVLIPKKR